MIIINGKEYSLNSNNKDLLKELPQKVKRYNPDTGMREEFLPKYLPISIVYDLLNGLFDKRDFKIYEIKKIDTYEVIKDKWEPNKKQKEQIKDVVERIRLTGSLIVYNGTKIINIDTYAEGIVSSGIYTNDQTLNGFNSKLEARAIKRATKKLGRVFRVDDIEEEDVEEINSIIENANIINTKIIEPTQQQTQNIPIDQFIKEYILDNADKFNNKTDFKKSAKELKDLLKIKYNLEEKDDDKQYNVYKDIMNKLYNELKN